MAKFTCAKCRGVFDKTGSDHDARAEHTANFPEVAGLPRDQLSVLCDDCYAAFRAWFVALPQSKKDAMAAEANQSNI